MFARLTSAAAAARSAGAALAPGLRALGSLEKVSVVPFGGEITPGKSGENSLHLGRKKVPGMKKKQPTRLGARC